jgi:hypothetical protein
VINFEKELEAQRNFSREAFGPYFRPKGIIDHIRKELFEIEADPFDVEEWIDVAILAFDGAMRSGRSPEEILIAYAAKQEKNRSRNWPDWKQSDPDKAIEHIQD